MLSCSVMSDSLQAQGLKPARLFCPWNFPDKNTGAGCHFLVQGTFLTHVYCLLHWQVDSLPLVPPGGALIMLLSTQKKSLLAPRDTWNCWVLLPWKWNHLSSLPQDLFLWSEQAWSGDLWGVWCWGWSLCGWGRSHLSDWLYFSCQKWPWTQRTNYIPVASSLMSPPDGLTSCSLGKELLPVFIT